MSAQREATATATPVFDGFHHVKVPVTEVGASREWYEQVLGLSCLREFVEDGVLMGVALIDATGSVSIALRQDPERAAGLRGFDPLAIRVGSAADVRAWKEHLDGLDQSPTEILTASAGGAVLTGLHDPDGIEIRFYADPL